MAFEERHLGKTQIKATVLEPRDGVRQALFEVPVSGDRKERAQNPSVAIAPDGKIAVVWEEIAKSGEDESGKNVMLVVIDADGKPSARRCRSTRTCFATATPIPRSRSTRRGRVIVSHSAHAGSPDAAP